MVFCRGVSNKGADLAAGTIGELNHVAILPAYEGQGLARPFLGAVLRRFVESGHTGCVLGTETSRLPAISLYLRMGFLPDLLTDPRPCVASRPPLRVAWESHE